MATVVAVFGTIAGAGTTTVVTALGTALGEQRRQVAVVDATAEGSRLTDTIGVEGGGEVTDALRRGTAIPEVQADAPHDVAAFPAGPETSWGAVRPDAVDDLYDQLRDRFEFVLVDCGNEPCVDRAAWLGHADEIVIVTDPDVADAVPDLVALADAFEVPVRGVLASRVPPKEVGDAIEALDRTDQTVLGVLPEDPTVGAAAASRTSILRTEPDSLIATSAWEFALRFRQRDHDEPVVPAGTVPDSVELPSDEPEGESDAETAGDSEAETATVPDPEPAGETEAESDQRSDPGPGGEATDESGETPEDEPDTAPDETASPAPAEDGFETPDPQPVEEEISDPQEQASPDDGHDARPSDGEAGGASAPNPSRAAPQSTVAEPDSDEEGVETGGETGADQSDDEAAELSDEEIEAVFQETMQRVKDRREREEADRDE